jgi:hypothetical protein
VLSKACACIRMTVSQGCQATLLGSNSHEGGDASFHPVMRYVSAMAVSEGLNVECLKLITSRMY